MSDSLFAPKPIEILLVEDSPSDRALTVAALDAVKLRNTVHCVEDGVSAMRFLRRDAPYTEAPRPDLILLDLNLPRKDGREVLAEIKSDPFLKKIPVIVLTTSDDAHDIEGAYAVHANSYITKPVDFQRFGEAVGALSNYWFEIVSLPAFVETPQIPQLPAAITETMRVLVLEDSPTDALLLREALNESTTIEFETTMVDRLSRAIGQLEKTTFDLIMTDLSLPDANGLATYRALRTAAPHLPIIVLTGTADEEVGPRFLLEGAQDYLVKGKTDAANLVRAVRYARDRMNAQQQLHRAQRMEAVGQLAGGVAHDFNNLLTIIRGSASLLRRPLDEEERSRFLDEIDGAAQRGARLTRQLLTFSKRRPVDHSPLDLNLVVGQMLQITQRVIGAEVAVELRLSPDPIVVEGDIGSIEQVIMNLVVNARDAMPAGGKLTLTTGKRVLDEVQMATQPGKAGAYCVVSVRDTGSGIDPKVLNKIWDPFFTTKTEQNGTGLGLATVQGVVRQHGGFVGLDSELGVGSTFEVFLPASDSPLKAAPKESSEVVDDADTACRILFVEDEKAVSSVVSRLLRREGHQVVVADSARVAIELFDDSIDLVLTDMVMPGGLSGGDLAEALREIRPDLPVIFSSGYSEELMSLELDPNSGSFFLPKPYGGPQLREAIDDALKFARGSEG